VKRYHILPVRFPDPPRILTTNLPAGTVGVPYSFQLAATGGVAPYTWSLVSANPNTGNWIVVSSSGLITGTPGTAEAENLQVRVTDSFGTSVQQALSMIVNAAGGATITHNQVVTYNGSGYGTQSGTLILNDSGGAGLGVLDAQWNGGSAPSSSNPTYVSSNPVNRASNYNPTGANVGFPHPFCSAMIAGAHWTDAGAWISMVALKFTIPTPPCCLWLSCYLRSDSNWSFTPGESTNDHNLKGIAYGPTTGGVGADTIYTGPTVGSPSNNSTVTTGYNLTSNFTSTNVLVIPDRNGSTGPGHGNAQVWAGGQKPNQFNPSFGWPRLDFEMCIDTATGISGKGYVRASMNCSQYPNYLNYAERTDGAVIDPTHWPGTTRYLQLSDSVFARDYGPGFNNNLAAINNVWYIADAKAGLSGGSVSGHFARTVVGDAPTYAASVVTEPATPVSRANGSVSFKFQQGKFTSGQTVYAHDFNEAGQVQDAQGTYTVL
jgi:hypothetical protein